jgi:hypothetical protein
MLNHLTIAIGDGASLRCPHPTPPELSVLVPTRNEAANIEELLQRISTAVAGIPTEVVFIDDSDDATPDVSGALPTGAMAEPVRSRSFAGRAPSEQAAWQGPSSTASARPAHPGLASSTRTFSIPPRPSRGCWPRRTATGPTWWWPAGTASRDAPKGSGWSAG